MQKIIPSRIEDGRISLDQDMLPKAWLDQPIEAVVKSYGILIKPRSFAESAGNRQEAPVVQGTGRTL